MTPEEQARMLNALAEQVREITQILKKIMDGTEEELADTRARLDALEAKEKPAEPVQPRTLDVRPYKSPCPGCASFEANSAEAMCGTCQTVPPTNYWRASDPGEVQGEPS